MTPNTAGRLDITVDWTFADSPVGVYVTPSTDCTTVAAFNARSCNFLIQSEPSTTKPRRVSAAVAAGSYRFMVANFATRDEAMATTVVLSSSSCPAFASSGEGTDVATTPQAAVALSRSTVSVGP